MYSFLQILQSVKQPTTDSSAGRNTNAEQSQTDQQPQMDAFRAARQDLTMESAAQDYLQYGFQGDPLKQLNGLNYDSSSWYEDAL